MSLSMRINQGLSGGQPVEISDPWGQRTVTGPVWSARSGEVFQRTGPKLANYSPSSAIVHGNGQPFTESAILIRRFPSTRSLIYPHIGNLRLGMVDPNRLPSTRTLINPR